jgi:hypothetical protein
MGINLNVIAVEGLEFRTMYVVGSKSFRPDIQKLRQMENVVRPSMVRLMYQSKSVLK